MSEVAWLGPHLRTLNDLGFIVGVPRADYLSPSFSPTAAEIKKVGRRAETANAIDGEGLT